MNACPSCGRGGEHLEELLQQERQDRQNAETLNRKLLREKAALKRELDTQRQQNPRITKAQELFDFAVQILGRDPKRTKWTPERQKLFLSAIETWEEDGVRKAFKGLAMRPWAGPRGRSAAEYPGSKKFVDFEHAIGSAKRVESCWSYVDEAEAERQKLAREKADTRGKAQEDLCRVYGRDSDDPTRPALGRNLGSAGNRLFGIDGIGRLLNALERHGCESYQLGPDSGKHMAQCPAHDDRDPSLSILEKPDGMVLVHCFAGCRTGTVLEVLGLEWGDLGGRAQLTDDRAERLGMRGAA